MKGPGHFTLSGSFAKTASDSQVNILEADEMPGEALEAGCENFRTAPRGLFSGLRIL